MATNDIDALADEIRDNTDGHEPVETNLETNQRIIARVTDGIYREPWAAFRELVANAYDADATHVVVETRAPEFDQITVRDNGIGMSAQTVAYILKNIGASSKRRLVGTTMHTVRKGAIDLSPAGRPLIGKIGIGLFAVAQLTQHFQIITKARDEHFRISATVRLQTHNEDAQQQNEDDYVAGTVAIKAENVSPKEHDTQGTSVILYSLRPEVRRTLQSTRRWEAVHHGEPGTESQQTPPTYHIGCPPIRGIGDSPDREPKLPWDQSDSPGTKFQALVTAASNTTGRGTKPADLDHFDEYLKLVWKLSLSLPLDYPDVHPFDLTGRDGLIIFTMADNVPQATPIKLDDDESIRSQLGLCSGPHAETPPFSVTLDGIALQRPLHLPKELAKKSRVPAPALLVAKQDDPFPPEDHDRAGGALAFEGYLYWNSKITPKDTTGVLVRIREASGTLFDPTFLNYQVSEQTRLRQITAEIFVKQGLDTAINIDRESFNYSHPHFLYVQRWLHKALRLLVNRLKTLAKDDLERERTTRREEEETYLQALAYEVWHRRLGEDADPPFTSDPETSLPDEVGGAEINWGPDEIRYDSRHLSTLSAILEAYGVLSNLPVEDRAQLLRDVLSMFENPK